MAAANNSISEENDLENSKFRGNGHFFTKKSFHKPTYCHHCADLLWGLIGQGYVCEVCNFIVHDRCCHTVVSSCSSIAARQIKNPVAHCWSEPGHFKRKFCNVCRKRLEDNWAIRCEICEYYAHLDCQDFVVSDCKECSTYVPQKDGQPSGPVSHYHHWREGNLPNNSKCLVCKKTCWSSECLSGMRCEWCGLTAHASCYQSLPAECNFGCLKEIVLPPYCLTMPRLDFGMDTLLGVQKRNNRAICDDWSSGDSKNDDDERKCGKEVKDKDRDKDEEVIKVFDGNDSMRKRLYRTISVPRNATASVVLQAALRTFHITDDPKNYYVSEATDKGAGEEKILEEGPPVRAQMKTPEGRRPSIFLRYRESDPDKGYLRVYTGSLRLPSKKPTLYKHIPVTKDTTTEEVIAVALKHFHLPTEDPANYNLMEALLDRGVTERLMESQQCPWQVMQKSRKDSLRQNRMLRLYIQQKEDPHGPDIALFIGNLPTGLSQRQYDRILSDILGKENRWTSFDVIYYEYGSLVIKYNSAEKAMRAFNILRQACFDEKQVLVMILPNIQAHMIPENTTPLLVFVNVKSGGCQGQDLIRNFRKLLNPHQVFNLENGGPLTGLYVCRNLPHYKILVCGGDGSVGWVLSCLDNVGQDALCQSPPMGIVPLGTGNDLARVLRWGPGYSGAEDPLNILRDVTEAEEIKLDRWTVIFHPNEKETNETKVALANDTNAADTNEDQTAIYVMNSYFGIGVEAEICLDFHNAREENPDRFNSRLHNKSVYFKLSLRKMVNRRSTKDLNRLVRIECDGKILDMPPIEGIIILNILSWASGANPWGPEKEDHFNPPTHYDGMLEVVGVTGVVHMGQIQGGLRSGVRLAQASSIRITLLTDVPVQVDGEPWVQPAGQVVVLRSALKATMLKKIKNKIKRRNTEPSIYFPNEPLSSQAQMSPDSQSGPL